MFQDPGTGAVAAVEADLLLDSRSAPNSVGMEVLARGPIGKYAFNLEAAHVTGEPRRLLPARSSRKAVCQCWHPTVFVPDTARPCRHTGLCRI